MAMLRSEFGICDLTSLPLCNVCRINKTNFQKSCESFDINSNIRKEMTCTIDDTKISPNLETKNDDEHFGSKVSSNKNSDYCLQRGNRCYLFHLFILYFHSVKH